MPTLTGSRLHLKCDGTRAETRFRLLTKRTSPFNLVGASVQSTTDSRGVCISSSNAGYTMFRGSVKCTGYPLHSPVSPSLPLPCTTVCHHISTGFYHTFTVISMYTYTICDLCHMPNGVTSSTCCNCKHCTFTVASTMNTNPISEWCTVTSCSLYIKI